MSVYPELVGVLGKTTVPDYRGRFLRGLQSGHLVGENVANSIKSHNHTQPTHTHSFSGQLVSTALSGTAGGQSFSSAANLGVSGWAAGQSITSGGAGGQSYQTQSGSSGGTWISIDQTGNDSGIAGGRVSIKRKTEEEIKGGGILGGGNKLVAPVSTRIVEITSLDSPWGALERQQPLQLQAAQFGAVREGEGFPVQPAAQ